MAPTDEAKRATTFLTIAQVKFKQALKKEDHDARPEAVPVEASSQFIGHLEAVLKQNTHVNIQTCTEWVVKHITPSKTRISVFGDYLVARSKVIATDQKAPVSETSKAARNRLDIILVVSDVLHSDTYHHSGHAAGGVFSKEAVIFINELVELAASCIYRKDSHFEAKLKAILNYWALNKLIDKEDFKTLRDTAEENLVIAQGGVPTRKRTYLLPEYHGDKNAPWFELPASYMLKPMIEHPGRPIDPHEIKVAKFDKKPVSSHVRSLLDNYFENIDLRYEPTANNPSGGTDKYNLSLDPMGQLVKQNKETGESTTVCNGYGWSMKFCDDMRKDGKPEGVRKARQEAVRMKAAQIREGAMKNRREEREYSRSPRRGRSPSSSPRGRGRRGRDRSHSRTRSDSLDSRSSRDSYDDRSRSHGGHRGERRQRSPRDGNKSYNDRGGRFDGRDSHRGSQWNTPNRGHQAGRGNQYPSGTPHNHGHTYQHQFAAQAPTPGQLPNVPFPPPTMPFPSASPGMPPPPPNFGVSFPPIPLNMTALSNVGYNNLNESYGDGYGNTAFGHGTNQGNIQGRGAHRGGHNANYRGGNDAGRGQHVPGRYGHQRGGHRGGRWN